MSGSKCAIVGLDLILTSQSLCNLNSKIILRRSDNEHKTKLLQLVIKYREHESVAVDIHGELGLILGDVHSLRLPSRLPQLQLARHSIPQSEHVADHPTLVGRSLPMADVSGDRLPKLARDYHDDQAQCPCSSESLQE